MIQLKPELRPQATLGLAGGELLVHCPIVVALPETAMESELSLAEFANGAWDECVAITPNVVAGTMESRRATTNSLGIAIDFSCPMRWEAPT
jgi:hypothetical protein